MRTGLGQIPDVGGEGAAWYCASVKPNCHARAEGELYRIGYRTFVPKLRKWVSHARTKKAVYRPLLGRYMFVEVDPRTQGFWRVRNTNGIEGLISASGGLEPIRIPTPQVEGLRLRQLRGEFDAVADESIPIGALVRIVEGQWEDLLGVLTKRRKGRLEVKLAGTSVTKSFLSMQVRPAA